MHCMPDPHEPSGFEDGGYRGLMRSTIGDHATSASLESHQTQQRGLRIGRRVALVTLHSPALLVGLAVGGHRAGMISGVARSEVEGRPTESWRGSAHAAERSVVSHSSTMNQPRGRSPWAERTTSRDRVAQNSSRASSRANPETPISALRGDAAPSPRMRRQRIGSLKPIVSAWRENPTMRRTSARPTQPRCPSSTPHPRHLNSLAGPSSMLCCQAGTLPLCGKGRVQQGILLFFGTSKYLIDAVLLSV